MNFAKGARLKQLFHVDAIGRIKHVPVKRVPFRGSRLTFEHDPGVSHIFALVRRSKDYYPADWGLDFKLAKKVFHLAMIFPLFVQSSSASFCVKDFSFWVADLNLLRHSFVEKIFGFKNRVLLGAIDDYSKVISDT